MSAPLPSMPPISAVRSPASPPHLAGPKDATAASQSTAPAKESYSALRPGGLKNNDNNHPMQSPTPPPPKLPELVVSPNNSSTSSPTTAPGRAPAQLALMLSNALADVDALKGALADEKRRTSRAERLLQTFHPNDLSMNEQTSDGAMKAILDAEARADRAERERDDALHALHSLSNHFAELERYESSLSLRASDARSAFTRLLAGITALHLPPASSPILSGSPPALSLPTLPPPLPTPSLNSVPSQRLNTAVPPPPSLSSRYTRSLPQAAPTFPSSSYSHGASHARESSLTHGSTFSCLPLPPPPSASGLGSGLIGALPAPPSSSSSSFSVPAKRSHRTRSTRGLDDGLADTGVWQDSKRRRMGNWDMDVDEPNASHLEQPLPYPHHQPSLSAQPTQRVFEHDRDHLQHQQPYTRSSAPYPPRYEEQREVNGNGPASVNGMVRLDARELVRDAKERERREKGYHPRHKDGETNRKSRRSASRSSWGSSSRSIDEMLLETATDGERGRRDGGLPSPRGQQNFGNFPTQAHLQDAGTALPPLSATREHKSERIGFHSSQPSSGSMSGVNGLVEKEKPVKVPATQLMTLGPGGVVVSGGGQAASAIPGGGFPPYNEAGQRICRQCGVPGRYKDGKCVEKWGPGPEGPGTVCDKCRKKMKRVERRGTLDGSVAAAQHQAFLAQRQSQPQLSSQGTTIPMAPSSNQSRTSLRSDTLVLDPSGRETSSSSQSKNTRKLSWIAGEDRAEVSGKARDRGEKDERSRGGPSRSHSPALSHHSSSLRQRQGQDLRRVPTPPNITSISTREQDDENVEEEEEYERDGNGELDVDAELAHAADVADSRKSTSRTSAHYSSSSSLSLSSDGARTGAPNGNSRPPRSDSRGSSSSVATADENSGSKKSPTSAPNGASSLRRIPLASDMALPRIRRRDTQDELYEDDEGDDADADADPDAEIMDAVDATMKIEE